MTDKPFTTPILFLIFNRPETTEKVFEKIREIQPLQLYVSADGPRLAKNDEKEKCEQARSIIQKVNWKCDLKINLSEKNLGCRVGVSTGIQWFFDQVTEGIILEDDCMPDSSFFHFCEVLLNYYKNDERVMHIGGINVQDGIRRGTGSYYFSKINHIWGWATWRRAWEKYDVNVSTYPRLVEQELFSTVFPYHATRKYWKKNIELVFNKKKDTWDIQWQYAVSVNNGLAIVPNLNLVSNIGFDSQATHTIDHFHTLANRPASSLATVEHPFFVLPDLQADAYTMRKYLNPHKFKKLWQLIRRGYTK